MSKKTKKSWTYGAALGTLVGAGIATIASVASVIACGGGDKKNIPSKSQVDTSSINLDSVKIFDNGDVQGLPQLPNGVHLDYFLDGQTNVVHDIHELGQLQAGTRLYLQLGADVGYALNGDLHKTSVLIDHHETTSTPAAQGQIHPTIVQVTPEALKPITVRQGETPALPTILGGTWVLEGGGTFDSNNYEPGITVTFTLQPASNDYEVHGQVQLLVTIHGVITDNTYQTFTTAEVHIATNGITTGLPSVATKAHWHYSAQILGKEIVLNNDGSFPDGTALDIGDVVTITVVADQHYEFSGAIPEGRDFKAGL